MTNKDKLIEEISNDNLPVLMKKGQAAIFKLGGSLENLNLWYKGLHPQYK